MLDWTPDLFGEWETLDFVCAFLLFFSVVSWGVGPEESEKVVEEVSLETLIREKKMCQNCFFFKKDVEGTCTNPNSYKLVKKYETCNEFVKGDRDDESWLG